MPGPELGSDDLLPQLGSVLYPRHLSCQSHVYLLPLRAQVLEN